MMRTTWGKTLALYGFGMLMLGGTAAAQVTSGAAAAQVRSFDIAKGDLKRALDDYSRQAGVQVIYRIEDVRGATTAGANGALDATAALNAILAKTGLSFSRDSSGAIAIVKNPPSGAGPGGKSTPSSPDHGGDVGQTLNTINVTAKAEGLAAMRVPTELREIPQSVSVISQELLQQQNATDLTKAFAWATGVTAWETEAGTGFSVRGFEVSSLHIDGGASLSQRSGLLSSYRELSEFDHIEVLRGADALFGGIGEPSATVNLVRKQPLAQTAASLTASVGSWENYHVAADASGPLGFDGALRGRVVGVVDDQNYFYDTAYRRLMKLYAVADYDLGQSTKLTLGGSIEQSDYIPGGSGLPRYANGADAKLPRSTALIFPWMQNTSTKPEVFAQLEHRFNEDWKLNANLTQIKQSQDGITASVRSAINPVTNLMSGTPTVNRNHASSTQQTIEVTLTGSFEWRDRKQDFAVGLDHSGSNNLGRSRGLNVTGPALNPFAFDPNAYPVPTPSAFAVNVDSESEGERYGAYTSLRLRPWDGLALIVGGRENYIRSESGFSLSVGPIPLSANSSKYTDTGVITPYAGFTYDLNREYSIYASYADVFSSNIGSIRADGSIISPMTGSNLEAGIKAAWNEGRLNGSLALFKIKQDNYITLDFDHTSTNALCCYLTGVRRSKGVETEFSGLLTRGWLLSAGYTFDLNRNEAGIALSTITPKHLIKLWTNYQLHGDWANWSIGGGFTAQSSNYLSGFACSPYDPVSGQCVGSRQPYRSVQGFYTVATLRAEYRINPHWSASLNIENLFDRIYYQSIASPVGGSWYGSPRNVMLKINGSL